MHKCRELEAGRLEKTTPILRICYLEDGNLHNVVVRIPGTASNNHYP